MRKLKKLTAILLVIVIALFSFSITVGATGRFNIKKDESKIFNASALDNYVVNVPTRQIGDANNDGIVNVVDATHIQKYLADYIDYSGNKLIDIDNSEDFKACDVNGDNTIDVRDATEIQKMLIQNYKEDLKMTDFIGMTVKELTEIAGDDYKLTAEPYEGVMLRIYYDNLPLIFGFYGNNKKIPTYDDCIGFVIYLKNEECVVAIDDWFSTNVTYGELRKANKGEVTENKLDGGFESQYEKEDIVVSFFWNELPKDNSIADRVSVSTIEKNN